ncbi:hypothetical protein GCM10010435_81140 [Winogradskya consettensis]|uniref:Uncharacterized protein n=1 Tax=Winogradskya consettensis TaxID=113560 RepID=A0A919VU60_9ACTN|nr:DUF6518 family protein [Actinoplanes consettensis]GIM75972.1 hypothetical protein Aco04nite_47990 [Actinoplanes consettensis]
MTLFVYAPVAGFLLGFLDFVWIKFVPFPLGDLGNSPAVWAVAAFLFVLLGRRWRAVPAVAGACVMLVVASPSYYLAAALIQHDDYAVMGNSTTIMWMGFGVVAGLVFGGAGALARTRNVALAVPVAVLVTEAIRLTLRIGDPDYGIEPLWTALLEVGIAVGLVVWLARSWRERARVVLATVPLAAAGFVLFSAAGFA